VIVGKGQGIKIYRKCRMDSTFYTTREFTISVITPDKRILSDRVPLRFEI
jgi:hypothetical protein